MDACALLLIVTVYLINACLNCTLNLFQFFTTLPLFDLIMEKQYLSFARVFNIIILIKQVQARIIQKMIKTDQEKPLTDDYVNYPYFKRSKAISFINTSSLHYKFKLLSIARNQVAGIDIYLTYFWSVQSKKIKEISDQQDLQKTHISQLFLFYIQIFTLKCMLNDEATSKPPQALISLIICDLMGEKALKPTNTRLRNFIKIYLNDLFDRKYCFLKTHEKQRQFEHFLQVQGKISQILKNIYSLVDQQQTFKKLKENQILPKNQEDKLIKLLIKENFKAICNIKTLSKRLMKRIFCQFYEINKCHYFMKIHKAFENKSNANQNQILMPAYSQEEAPVITEMHNIINKLHGKDPEAHILNELSRQLLLFSLHYTKDTCSFYPNISFTHLYLDQKSLRLIVSYNPLLLDALGLQEDTKNFELRLATEPTPKGVNYEQCYLQQLEENKLLLKYNYYCNQLICRGHQNESNDDNIGSLGTVHSLQEKIHVWRLLQVIYYIYHQRHFTNDYYNNKFVHSLDKNEDKHRPFYFRVYKSRLKEAYTSIEQGKLPLAKLLPISTQQNSLKSSVFPFSFTLHSLAGYFQIDDNDGDSLIENLRFQKIRQFLYERCMLCKQIINILMHPSFFKKWLNAKKYFLFYFVGIIEQAGFESAIRQKSKLFTHQATHSSQPQNSPSRQLRHIGKPKRNMNKILMQERIRSLFQQQINNLNISSEIEFRKKSNRQVYGKLCEYKYREDANKVFVQNNKSIMNNVEEIERQMGQISIYMEIEQLVVASDETNIQLLSQRLRCIKIKKQHKQSQLQKHIHAIIQLQEMISIESLSFKLLKVMGIKTLEDFELFLSQTIQQKLAKILGQASTLLHDFVLIHINNDFIQPESMHRITDLMNEHESRAYYSKKQVSKRLEQACRWYHLKLTVLAQALTCNESQLNRYQSKLTNLFMINSVKLPIKQISLQFFVTERLKIQQFMFLIGGNKRYINNSYMCNSINREFEPEYKTYTYKQVQNI